MKTGVRNARIIQLLGAVILVVAVARCGGGALTDAPGSTGWLVLLGGGLVLGARVYEFLTRE
jgi:hypothetical protein